MFFYHTLKLFILSLYSRKVGKQFFFQKSCVFPLKHVDIYSRGAQLISQIVPEIFLEGKWGHSDGLGAVPPVGPRGRVQWD